MAWTKRFVTRFTRDRRGAALMMMGLCLPVIAVVVAVSLDAINVMNTRAAMQQHLDAAVLSVARSRANTDAERSALALQLFQEGFKHVADNVDLDVKVIEPEDDVLKGEAFARVPRFFPPSGGEAVIPVRVTNEVRFGMDSQLELALALDTTYSMKGLKINALRDAAYDLVDELMAHDTVRVSVVPFARYVNVGTDARGEDWLDVEPDQPGTTSCKTVDTYKNVNCRTETRTCSRDGVTWQCSKKKCDRVKTGTKQKCSTSGKKTFRGCVGSREAPHNVSASVSTNKIPGLMNRSCNSEVLRLTDDESAVDKAIKKMKVNDETYIPAGIMWGWRTLTPSEPFPDGRDPARYEHKIRKALVLMTDGANTLQQWNGARHERGKSTADARKAADLLVKSACDKAKKAGIEIYTIAFEVNDEASKAMLKDCASGADNYYDANDANKLLQAFDDIGDSLTIPYLAG